METLCYFYHPDPSIWLSVDPLSDKYPNLTPYAYCANNPVILVDPDGRFPFWAVIGAVVEYGSQVYDNYKSGKSGYDAWVGDIDFLDVGAGKVTGAGSKKAVQNANKEVSTANQKLKTAERQAQRSPNSTKKAENVKNAESNLQLARNKQVCTKMLNSTVGKTPNATQQGASIITNRALKDEEKNKR